MTNCLDDFIICQIATHLLREYNYHDLAQMSLVNARFNCVIQRHLLKDVRQYYLIRANKIERYTERWVNSNDENHRDFDFPAVVDFREFGTKEWWQHGRCHREFDRPAVICGDGTQVWYRNGRIHRELDRPALIDPDGLQSWWYSHGKLHRDGGRPAVMIASLNLALWFQDGLPQKINGHVLSHDEHGNPVIEDDSGQRLSIAHGMWGVSVAYDSKKERLLIRTELGKVRISVVNCVSIPMPMPMPMPILLPSFDEQPITIQITYGFGFLGDE